MNKLYFLAVSLLFAASLNAQVVINEIMQSNIDCVMDDLNDYPDSWVELYNAGSEAVNLGEYSLGTSNKAKKAWTLPNTMLGPKCYAIVYCDKASDDWSSYPSTKRATNNWHTTFRLESGKDCALFLFKNGEIVDQLPEGMKKQPAPNISYGRKTDGSDKWGYQEEPTVCKANCGTILSNKDILGDPVFSIPGKVYTGTQNLSLTLSLPEGSPAGTVIRYTTNGSEPTQDSPVYENPISIMNTKIIRAKLFCKGKLSPRSVTQSYIMFPRNLTLPVVSIVTDNDYFYNTAKGIYVDGTYGGGKKNYEYNWRRPVNFEYFEEAGKESELNQLCETRVTGGATRTAPLKSLGVYANKRFGEKRLAYEFFPDQRPGITNFKSIMLRNAGNDFDYLYMRDAIIQRIMSENVDIDHQAWRPAIFYLNGKYMGMLNIRERSNEDNIYTNYPNEKGDDGLEDIDMIENWWELKEGTMDNWNAFQKFYTEHGHTYAEYDKLLDVQEFMDVMIMNLFFSNLDFPGNNIVWWRPQADGGRWRIIVKDTDFGIGLYGRDANYKTLEWLHNPNHDKDNAWANQYEHTRLFRRLEEDETFYNNFIDRFCIYMGDFMNYARTWEIWQQMYDKIKYEYPNHRNLFNPWWPNYSQELTNAQNWLKNRVSFMYNQLRDYYKLGTHAPFNINRTLSNGDLERIKVTFNGWTLTCSKFEGKFFAGRAVSLKGENVVGWEVTEISTSGKQTQKTIEGDTYTFTMPTCSSLNITAIVGDATSIENVVENKETEIDAVFDASGLRRSKLKDGLNIIRTKDGKSKAVWY